MSVDPSSLLPLTPAVFEILLALAEGDRHGYAILKAVTERAGSGVKLLPGTLYRALDRLLDSRLIEELDADSGDPRRRHYRLTTLGMAVLKAEAQRLAEQVDAARRLDVLEAK